MSRFMRVALVLWFAALMITSQTFAIGEDDTTPTPQPAEPAETSSAIVINKEGGPVSITGSVTYTNPFFTLGVAQPMIILEDQAGFVDRNEYFLFPPESQVLGQITSDFYTSPFTYSLSLPIEPQGTLRDVDNDNQDDPGVMVFAVAYWTNTFGDPFLEERDMYGGGWSGAYASTRVSTDPRDDNEIIGGKFIIYAPEEGQGFPSDYGPDEKLFTEDDPIVTVPQGYSVVNLDERPFTFDRSESPVIDLIEPDTAALVDYSAETYTAAWDSMVEKLSREYAFTDYYGIDWDALSERYRPRVETAELSGDATAFALAIRDFLWEIPDGHVGMSLDLLIDQFTRETDGGVGLAIRELSDGRVIVNFVTPGSPAAQEGIQLGAEILEWGGQPIDDALENTFIWAHQALGTQHTKRLQQLRYVTRSEVGTPVEITYQNPDDEEPVTVTLNAVPERQSFTFSSFNSGVTGNELPVEFSILPSGYGYVSIYSFSDDEYLTIQLWERMIRTFKEQDVPGIIIDMRNNGGGSGFLADQMTAYFFDEPLVVGNSGAYNEDLGEFYFDERGADRLYLPAEELRYHGPVAVIVAPSCFSACEFFSYNLTIDDRAAVIGHYPTGGLGGSIRQFLMPEGITITFTGGRAVDADGNIHIEGQGVAPTHEVPVTENALLGEEDVLLQAAENALTEQIRGVIVDGGTLGFGNNRSGSLTGSGIISPGEALQYEVNLLADTVVSFYASGAADSLDTMIRILDSSGAQILAENDDSPEGVSSALEGLSVGASDLTVLVEITLKDDQPANSEVFLNIQAVPAEQSE